MNTARQLDPATLADYLARHERKTLLRLLTCGSVDDGKSTLVGRLLYDTRLLFEDQLASLRRDARRHGTADGAIDFALLVDGLEAEREQGITLDVAYRFFATDRRTFIVADTPGHEQYTRNMATGASNADLAVILVDARKGLLVQTRRHAFIASLLGIRHAVLAVNKIDLVDNTRAVFERIVRDFQAFARDLDFRTLQPIPLSARFGDNLTRRSETLDWYCGPTLLEYLETVQIDEDLATRPFRMPVQWVNRPTPDFRGFSGTLAAGTVRPGDTLCVAGSGRTATVKSVVTFDGEKPQAVAGEAVTLTLDEDIDVSRGDLLAAADDRPEVTDQFAAHVIWMHDDPLLAGRPYLVKLGTREVTGSVTEIKHKIDIESFQRLAAKTVALNDVAFVNLSLQEPVAFDPYTSNRTTGGFVLIDRLSNLTVGAGMIDFGLRRATNIHWQAVDVNREARAAAKGQKPVLLWFTGLSGAGKSAVANCVEKKLYARGRHTYLLDGDNVRHGLNRDLGFTDADRVENIRRVAETARLMVDAGLIVLASFISPFRSERQLARELLGVGEFVEIFVDTPLHIAEERDPKGLYKRARAGQIKNFTGIDSPYEAPTAPDIRLAAGAAGLDEMADEIVHYLDTHGYLG